VKKKWIKIIVVPGVFCPAEIPKNCLWYHFIYKWVKKREELWECEMQFSFAQFKFFKLNYCTVQAALFPVSFLLSLWREKNLHYEWAIDSGSRLRSSFLVLSSNSSFSLSQSQEQITESVIIIVIPTWKLHVGKRRQLVSREQFSSKSVLN